MIQLFTLLIFHVVVAMYVYINHGIKSWYAECKQQQLPCSLYLHPLPGADQSILLCRPAAEQDTATGTPT